MPDFMIALILHINLLDLSWLKNIYIEDYGAFKG